MLRMKAFTKVYIDELECAVNDWIREHAKVIEIVGVPQYAVTIDEYSVVIFYKAL